MPASTRFQLLEDGSLELDVEDVCLPAVTRWLPRFPTGLRSAPAPDVRGVIEVRPAGAETPSPGGKPSLQLSSISAWIDDSIGIARLHGSRAASHGSIDLNGLSAILSVPSAESEERNDEARNDEARNDEAFTMLTISAALLLGRLRRTLVHAAGAIAPDGGCWLLIGDTHAGKTTTTINLVRGGWGFLSDDHVVVRRVEGVPHIEGWPRPFHVDEGWRKGQVTGLRTAVDPSDFGMDRWVRSAPLAGLLFPTVNADAPTRLEPIAPAAALSMLIRQTPWLVADRGSASHLLELLGRVAEFPAFRLSVGQDSYADSAVLLRQFEGVLSST